MRPHLPAFIAFAGVSGGGWILDFSLLLWLVRAFDAPPALANLVSALTAAAVVFLVSRGRIFTGARGAAGRRLSAYLIYTAVLVICSSAALSAIARWVGRDLLPEDLAVVFAKVIVTPPQLAANFLVARLLNLHVGRASVA